MIVQACLNGSRAEDFHPALPLTADALAADALACVAAGAAEFHIHPRGPDGRESLAAEAIDAAVAALRACVPGALVGVSTGAWIEGDEDRRLACIEAWRERPDHASVNLGEAGAPAVIERLLRRGIGLEAGLSRIPDAERLVALGLGEHAFRILVEPDHPEPDAALAEAEGILRVLARAGLRRPMLMHGNDAAVWPLVARAASLRLSTRVGLEDGAELPDGGRAAGNPGLVAAAVAMLRRPAG